MAAVTAVNVKIDFYLAASVNWKQQKGAGRKLPEQAANSPTELVGEGGRIGKDDGMVVEIPKTRQPIVCTTGKVR